MAATISYHLGGQFGEEGGALAAARLQNEAAGPTREIGLPLQAPEHSSIDGPSSMHRQRLAAKVGHPRSAEDSRECRRPVRLDTRCR